MHGGHVDEESGSTGDVAGYLDRQPGLAHAADACDGDEAVGRKHGDQLVGLPRAAEKAVDVMREAVTGARRGRGGEGHDVSPAASRRGAITEKTLSFGPSHL